MPVLWGPCASRAGVQTCLLPLGVFCGTVSWVLSYPLCPLEMLKHDAPALGSALLSVSEAVHQGGLKP